MQSGLQVRTPLLPFTLIVTPTNMRLLLALILSATAAFAGDARLNLSRTPSSTQVQLNADAATEYQIESAASLDQQIWNPIVSVNLTNTQFAWPDASASTGNRFYRAHTIPEDPLAQNFRLIDHQGKSRELYYHELDPALKAIVITFARSNYTAFASKILKLKTNSAYSAKVLFWTIDTDPNVSRTNIAQQATSASVSWPVFQDPLQLVARDYDPHFNGEVFVVSTFDGTIAYRGLIDDAVGSSAATRNYLAEALDKLLASAPVYLRRVEPTTAPINRFTRPIADYGTTIAPILQAKCVVCHSPDNIAPFAMTNYNAVAFYADSMKEAIMAKEMPPWHADPLYGKFQNDVSLTDTELTQLIDWLNAGHPRGAGADPLAAALPPPPPKWPIELGPPDEIVTIPPQSVVAVGTEAYRYIYANATNATPKYLRAAVVRPSNKAVVHHYIVWQGHSTTAQLSGIATYVPGHNDRPYPAGTGVSIPANAPLTFNLHYTANGASQVDQPELGLWYTNVAPAKTLKIGAAANPFINIPPNTPEYSPTVPTTFTFSSKPATIFSLSPHMHVRGLRMKFDLTLPDGSSRTLLSVPKYDFDWQTIYVLDPPLDVPLGAKITVSGAYDNSVMNIYNPNPNATITWGEQSWDEMFIGYLEYCDR
jgi:hypothetical protein